MVDSNNNIQVNPPSPDSKESFKENNSPTNQAASGVPNNSGNFNLVLPEILINSVNAIPEDIIENYTFL